MCIPHCSFVKYCGHFLKDICSHDTTMNGRIVFIGFQLLSVWLSFYFILILIIARVLNGLNKEMIPLPASILILQDK